MSIPAKLHIPGVLLWSKYPGLRQVGFEMSAAQPGLERTDLLQSPGQRFPGHRLLRERAVELAFFLDERAPQRGGLRCHRRMQRFSSRPLLGGELELRCELEDVRRTRV